MQELDTENYKILLKEMKENLTKWKHIHIHGVEDSIIKLTILPKLIYGCKNPYQNPSLFLWRSWQADPKIHMEIQGTQNSENNLEKEQNWKAHPFLFQNFLQSYNNQDSVVLT